MDLQFLNKYMFERGNPYKYTDPTGHCAWDACIAEAVVIYSVVETIIDVVGTTLDVMDLMEDYSNVDNRIAVELDLIDLFSGPISNPGSSGRLYKAAQNARVGLQVNDVVKKKVDHMDKSTDQNKLGGGMTGKSTSAPKQQDKKNTVNKPKENTKKSNLGILWDVFKQKITSCIGAGCSQKSNTKGEGEKK